MKTEITRLKYPYSMKHLKINHTVDIIILFYTLLVEDCLTYMLFKPLNVCANDFKENIRNKTKTMIC